MVARYHAGGGLAKRRLDQSSTSSDADAMVASTAQAHGMAPDAAPDSSSADTRSVTALQVLVALGIVARFVIWLVSEGSNDARIWLSFAKDIDAHGVIAEYTRTTRFNHPPLMGLWSVAALDASRALGISFAKMFKLLPLAADLLSIPLVMFALRRRGLDVRAQWAGAAVVSTSVVSILVAGYHGNTDALCTFLMLLAVILVDSGRFPLLAGLAFSAALNVKLIPLVLAPALFVMQARSIKHAVLFVVGGVLGILPFVPPIIEVGASFYKNAIAYNSSPNRWGIHFALDALSSFKAIRAPIRTLDGWWATVARYVILGVGFLLAVRARRRGGRTYEVAAAAMCAFLVLAPGVGVQYFIFPLPLVVLVSRRLGVAYGLLAGLFIASVYVSFSPLTLPLSSFHRGPFGVVPGLVGIPTWLVLLAVLVAHLRTPQVRFPAQEAPDASAAA